VIMADLTAYVGIVAITLLLTHDLVGYLTSVCWRLFPKHHRELLSHEIVILRYRKQ
jgi:hypothetical protein